MPNMPGSFMGVRAVLLLIALSHALAVHGADPAGAPGAGQDTKQAEVATQRRIRELRRRAIENAKKGQSRLLEARRNLMDLLNLQPYVPDYHLALAFVLRREGRLEEFYRKLNDVLDLNGPKQIVYLFMAEYYMLRGNKQKALSALGQAAQNGMNIMEAVSHIPALRGLRTDTEFVKLSLSLERFTLRSLQFPQNFRDPFVPSRLWQRVQETEQSPTPSVAGPKASLPDKHQQAQLLIRAKAALAAIERYIKNPQADDSNAIATYQELKALIAKKHRITIPRIAREFDAIERKLTEIETQLQDLKLRYYWEQAEAKIAAMRQAFENTEYEKVAKIHQELSTLVSDMTKANRIFEPAGKRIMQVGEYWFRRAQIRSEFAKKNLTIVGIVTSNVNGKEANFVIINKKRLTEGDFYDDFVVDRIERNRVTVRYKGERIGLVFRRY